MAVKCPQCHNDSTILGKVYNVPDYINPPAIFRPSAQSFFAIFNNVEFPNEFTACMFCGFIWGRADPQRLQKFTSSREAM